MHPIWNLLVRNIFLFFFSCSAILSFGKRTLDRNQKYVCCCTLCVSPKKNKIKHEFKLNNYNNVQWFFIELVLWMVSWNSKCSWLYGSNRILLRAHITYIHLICICSSAMVDLESLYRQGNLFFVLFICHFHFSVQICMHKRNNRNTKVLESNSNKAENPFTMKIKMHSTKTVFFTLLSFMHYFEDECEIVFEIALHCLGWISLKGEIIATHSTRKKNSSDSVLYFIL